MVSYISRRVKRPKPTAHLAADEALNVQYAISRPRHLTNRRSIEYQPQLAVSVLLNCCQMPAATFAAPGFRCRLFHLYRLVAPASPCRAVPRLAKPNRAKPASPCPALPSRAKPRLAQPCPASLALPRPASPSQAQPGQAPPRHACLASPRLTKPGQAWPRHAAPRLPCLTTPRYVTGTSTCCRAASMLWNNAANSSRSS